MTIDSAVLKTLQRQVISDIENSPYALPVQAIDVSFTVPNNQKYYELVNNPIDQGEFWGNEEIVSGVFNIVLHYPLEGSGAYSKIERLEYFKSLYFKGRNIFANNRRVLIDGNPRIGGVQRGKYVDGVGFTVANDGSHTLTALSLPYASFIVPTP